MDIGTLLHLVVQIIVVGAICWLIWWLIDYFGLPEPFNKIGKGLVAVVAAIFLIQILLGLGGFTGSTNLKKWW